MGRERERERERERDFFDVILYYTFYNSTNNIKHCYTRSNDNDTNVNLFRPPSCSTTCSILTTFSTGRVWTGQEVVLPSRNHIVEKFNRHFVTHEAGSICWKSSQHYCIESFEQGSWSFSF